MRRYEFYQLLSNYSFPIFNEQTNKKRHRDKKGEAYLAVKADCSIFVIRRATSSNKQSIIHKFNHKTISNGKSRKEQRSASN